MKELEYERMSDILQSMNINVVDHTEYRPMWDFYSNMYDINKVTERGYEQHR